MPNRPAPQNPGVPLRDPRDRSTFGPLDMDTRAPAADAEPPEKSRSEDAHPRNQRKRPKPPPPRRTL